MQKIINILFLSLNGYMLISLFRIIAITTPFSSEYFGTILFLVITTYTLFIIHTDIKNHAKK